MTKVTIGFIPRDRYCRAAESLRMIFDATQNPFDMIVVDIGIPQVFRREMDKVLEERPNVRIIRGEKSLSSNGCRNLVLNHVENDYVCLIENDVIVEPGWLERLLNACEGHPADVAVPLLLEPFGNGTRVHFDNRLGAIEPTEDGRLAIRPVAMSRNPDAERKRRTVNFIEMHCILFRRTVFERIGGFDAELGGSRAEVDISLALHESSVRAVLEPNSRVLFAAPPPVYDEERDEYRRYWDLNQSERDHRRIEKKWRLVECPSSLGFCRARLKLLEESDPALQEKHYKEWVEKLEVATQELAEVVPEGETLVLIDDMQWEADQVAKGRRTFPFLERNGQYAGVASDSDTAIRELKRMVESGAAFLVLGWPGFWWLEHYTDFRDYLRTRFPCMMENERLIVFDLRRPNTG